MTTPAGGANDPIVSELMKKLDQAEAALSSGSALPKELTASIHESAEKVRVYSAGPSRNPKLQDRASSVKYALNRLDKGIDKPDTQAQITAIKSTKAFLTHNLGVKGSAPASQIFPGSIGVDEVCQYIQHPTSHPHWIRFQENMNRSFPKMTEAQAQEVFRKTLCGITWNLLKTMPLETLVQWNPKGAPPEVLKIRDSLIEWQIQVRQEYGAAVAILKSSQISDPKLQKEIDALDLNPANIDEAFKKAQILVDKVRQTPSAWEAISNDKHQELNGFSPAPPVAKSGLASSANIYSAVQQHTMATRSGRGGNPYFEHALQEIRSHDKDACQSLDPKFRRAPVSLWGGGIEISNHAHDSGYQVLEHSKLGAAFNGVQLHPSYPTYEPLWERLSQEFVRYHVESQRHKHPKSPPELTIHTRTLNQYNIGQMIELPTALGISQKGGEAKLQLHIHPMATDDSGKAIRLMPLNTMVTLSQESTELLRPLHELFLGFYEDYKALQEAFEAGKKNPNLAPPKDYEAKRVLINANLWGIQEARKIEAEQRGDPPPSNLSRIEPWPIIGSSGRSKINPDRRRMV